MKKITVFLLSVFIFSGLVFAEDDDFIMSSGPARQIEEQKAVEEVKDTATSIPAAAEDLSAAEPSATPVETKVIAIETEQPSETPAIVVDENGDTEGIIILLPGETEPSEIEKFIAKKKEDSAPQEKRADVDYGDLEERGEGGEFVVDYEDAGEGELILVEDEKKGKIQSAGYVLVERAGFISDNFADDGFIYTVDNKLMMVQNDRAYVKITVGKSVKAGSELMIYDDSEEIFDKETGEMLGKLVKVNGVARVTKNIKDNIFQVVITKSYDPIGNKDKIKLRREVKDYQAKLSRKVKSKNVERQGSVIKTVKGPLNFKNKDIVYINIGLDKGILPGEKLEVLRETPDPENKEPDLYHVVGSIMVINSMKSSATAIVIEQSEVFSEGYAVKTIAK